MKKQPNEITLCNLEVVLMPNGEIICWGKTIGWFNEFHKHLTKKAKAENSVILPLEVCGCLFMGNKAELEKCIETLIKQKEKEAVMEYDKKICNILRSSKAYHFNAERIQILKELGIEE